VSILDLAADCLRVESVAKVIGKGPGTGNFRKKVVSDALAVHPDQIQEQIAHDKKLGVSVEFKPDGRPVFDNSQHFRRYAKAHGFRHRGY